MSARSRLGLAFLVGGIVVATALGEGLWLAGEVDRGVEPSPSSAVDAPAEGARMTEDDLDPAGLAAHLRGMASLLALLGGAAAAAVARWALRDEGRRGLAALRRARRRGARGRRSVAAVRRRAPERGRPPAGRSRARRFGPRAAAPEPHRTGAADARVLRQRVRELERANAALGDFAQLTAHELKAPLRAIAGLSEMLDHVDEEPELLENRPALLALLGGRVRRLEQLIDGLLTLGRSERLGQAAVDDVALEDVSAAVVALLAPAPGQRVVVAGPLPRLRAPSVGVHVVLQNLVGNALKHMGRAEGCVRISAEQRDGAVLVHVADDGPGIAPQHHARIFERFETVVPRDTVEGSGLGLAIVAKIVSAWGGQVWVTSDVGVGSTFHFSVPQGERPC